MEDLLRTTAERAARYLADLKERGVAPTPEALANLRRLDEPLPEHPTDPSTVIRLLDEIGSPATLASAGGRFFGFVVGGSLPAAVARSEEHTSELQSRLHLVCRLLLEKKKKTTTKTHLRHVTCRHL